jgi:F0F1-type ATP synthase assembly protein I
MVIIVVLGVMGGRWLDNRMENETPWWTLVGVILGITGALYYLFKGVRAGMKNDL